MNEELKKVNNQIIEEINFKIRRANTAIANNATEEIKKNCKTYGELEDSVNNLIKHLRWNEQFHNQTVVGMLENFLERERNDLLLTNRSK